MAGRKDIVGKALKVAADYFAPNTDEYAANLSKFYGSTDPALRKRFYTGTSKDKDFTAFQESRHGTWLTDDPEDASSYALNNDSQNLRLVPGTWNYEAVNSASRVIPSYARIENPYRGDKPDWVMKQDNYKKAQSDWFDQLRSQGYDAWVPDSSNGSLAVVLKNQGTNVKSAIGNQGTFDTTKKHMGKSEGGRTGYQTKGRVVGSVVGDAVDAAMRLIAGAEPQKTVKAYKLFKQEGGKLYPLFVGANEEVPMNQWVKATAGPQAASGKVKSKIGELAYRPGWHAGDLPIATHIGAKSHGDPSLPPDTRPSNQVWGEVEMANDVDWQKVANERARITKKGTPDPKTAHITDQVPYGGYYRYKTNPNMTGEWLIGGDMRVNRVLTDDEVKAINEAAGVSDLPRREGYGPGGVIDDIVKMAGKIVSGADEPAKTGIRAYHSSPHDFDKFEWSPRTSGTGEGAQAYGAGLYFAESPKVSGRGGTYDKQFTRKLMELDRTGGDTRMSRLKIGNKPLTSYGVEYDPEFIDAVKSGRELDYAQNKLNRWHELSADEAYPYRDYAAEKMKAWEQLLNDMHSGKNAYYPTKSRIYEVEINADPNLLLRWDEPLKNQPPSVLKGLGFTNPEDVSALQKERSEIERRMGEKGWGNLPQSTNFDDFWKEVNNSVSENSEDYNRLMKINKELSNAGKDIPDITAGKFYKKNSERPENISLSLREQGVPGIQFWDGNSRNDPFLSQWRTDPEARWTTDAFPSEHEARQYLSSVWPGRDLSSLDERFGRVIKNPQATSNYVITDDSLIDIKKKYNRGGSADNNSVSGALNVARGLQGGM